MFILCLVILLYWSWVQFILKKQICLSEHQCCLRSIFSTHSAVTEHQHDAGDRIFFGNMALNARQHLNFPKNLCEPIKITIKHNNMNRNESYHLALVWMMTDWPTYTHCFYEESDWSTYSYNKSYQLKDVTPTPFYNTVGIYVLVTEKFHLWLVSQYKYPYFHLISTENVSPLVWLTSWVAMQFRDSWRYLIFKMTLYKCERRIYFIADLLIPYLTRHAKFSACSI